mmetsp:Transcript_107615/g.213816  ORF Transcript_107615/g.213816 Transcript_107615/m.213816 type:complete len:120 (+) Transcript_107615:3171-3530(+)
MEGTCEVVGVQGAGKLHASLDADARWRISAGNDCLCQDGSRTATYGDGLRNWDAEFCLCDGLGIGLRDGNGTAIDPPRGEMVLGRRKHRKLFCFDNVVLLDESPVRDRRAEATGLDSTS